MTIIQIANTFKTESEVTDYFEYVRWGKKPTCSCCGSQNVSKRYDDFRYHCSDCRQRFSVTSNTHLHHTRLSLRTWLFAFAIISDAKKGVSALQLQRNLGMTYKTAWKMYHQIREIMTDGEVDLVGIVEMDETYVGGKPRKYQSAKYGEVKPQPLLDEKLNKLKGQFQFKQYAKPKKANTENAKRGRGTDKMPVVGIVERNGNVVAEVMKKTNWTNFKKMVQKYVDMPNSVLLTDEFKAYNRFDAVIEHIKIDHQKFYSYKGLNTNSIESFWAIIKRGIMGQYHSVSEKYLPNYVDEFCFKYNNRKFDDMFETLVFNSMLPDGFEKKEANSNRADVKRAKVRAIRLPKRLRQ